MKQILTLFCAVLMLGLGQAKAQANPMGTTWVVFIENSEYQHFPSIAGPKQDVEMMKEALGSYQIDKVLHKENLTKAALDGFFQKELPGLVKANNIKSLLVWYAGHGKYINDQAYWIPTDAQRDNETSYFELGALKRSLSVMPGLTHSLVVSDACESGPSFYQAMRSNPPHRQCGDYAPAAAKSSQVFTAAGYELAAANSQFTSSFANSLSANSNECIPIEKIVSNVTMEVVMSSSQRPKFGNINGATDEGGTFFFIKK